MLWCESMPPSLSGKTNRSRLSPSPANRGKASFHSRSVVITIGASGTSRRPALLFGEPRVFQRSARCLTVNTRSSKLTSSHSRPRNSEARNPVKIAVVNNGRSWPACSSIARSSSFVGRSTPTCSFRVWRFSTRARRRSPRAASCTTLRATWPRAIASARVEPNDETTLPANARLRRAGSRCGVRGKCRQYRSPRCGRCARCLGNPAARQRWAQCSHRLQLRGNTWPCGRGRTDDRVARSRRRSNRRRGACDSSATLGKQKNGSGDRASPMIVRAAYRRSGN